jgi:hypothetical protein
MKDLVLAPTFTGSIHKAAADEHGTVTFNLDSQLGILTRRHPLREVRLIHAWLSELVYTQDVEQHEVHDDRGLTPKQREILRNQDYDELVDEANGMVMVGDHCAIADVIAAAYMLGRKDAFCAKASGG